MFPKAGHLETQDAGGLIGEMLNMTMWRQLSFFFFFFAETQRLELLA